MISSSYRKSFPCFAAAVALLLLAASAIHAQTTAFTYQGKLTDGGNPASGSYDLQFALFDSGGTQIGSPLTRAGTVVAGGIFTVQLDFGVGAFPGANRFLEIGVRPAGVGSFTTLSPRQQISSTPYAIRTLSAATADTATNSTQLGGVAASQYVQTTDSRLSDARPPTAGSANYIQNTTTQQSSASLNISGGGIFGGNLIANGGIVGIGSSPGIILSAGGGTSGTQGGWFGTQSNHPLFFYTNNALPRMTIGTDGNVGIGTAAPASRLSVFGTNIGGSCGAAQIGWGVVVRGCSSALAVTTSDVSKNLIEGINSSGTVFLVTGSGAVGVGTGFPQRSLHVNGRARIGFIPLEASAASVCFNAVGDLLQCGVSSLRLKTNIAQFRSGLDIVRRLRPISFNWKEDGRPDVGLGAEDVAQVAPSFTFTDTKGAVTGVKYERLNMLLINAIKEQQEQIEALRAQNVRLTARLRGIEKSLRKRVGSSRRR